MIVLYWCDGLTLWPCVFLAKYVLLLLGPKCCTWSRLSWNSNMVCISYHRKFEWFFSHQWNSRFVRYSTICCVAASWMVRMIIMTNSICLNCHFCPLHWLKLLVAVKNKPNYPQVLKTIIVVYHCYITALPI